MADNEWEDVPETELSASSATDWEDVPEEESGNATEAFLGGAFQDLSMGLSDELKGGLEAAGQAVGVKGLGQEFGKQEFQEPIGLNTEKLLDVYRQSRDLERQRVKELEQQNPTAYTAGEVTGMVGPALVTGGASALKGLLKTGAKEFGEVAVKEGLKEGAEQLTKDQLKTLAKSGATMGGAGALGYSESDALEQPEELAKEVAQGATLGAALSTAAPSAIKLGKDALKKSGKLLKEGSKQITAVMAGLKKGTVEDIIERADDIKNAIDYPEIQEIVMDKTRKVMADIGKFSDVASEKLSDEKNIPKDFILKHINKRIENITGTADDSAIPHLEKILDSIKPKNTPELATNSAVEKLTAKLKQKSIEGDTLVGDTREVQNAINKMRDKINKLSLESSEVGQRSNFGPLKVEGDRVIAFDTVNGKVLTEKIKPLKVTPKFTKIKVKPNDGIVYAEDLTTGKIYSEQIPQVNSTKSKYEGELLSLRDVQKIVQDIGKRAYRGVSKDSPDAVKKQLRESYRELSEILKEAAPKEFRQYQKEISNRYDLLDKMEKKLGVKTNFDDIVVDAEDKLIRKLQEVGKEDISGRQKTDIEKLLGELEEIRGVKAGESTLSDLLKARKLKGELEKGSSEYSYAARTLFGGLVGSLVPGLGNVAGAAAALASRPVTRAALKRSGALGKMKLGEKAAKFVDKGAELASPLVLGSAGQGAAKVAVDQNKMSTKLEDPEYIQNLINEFKASDKSSMNNYADDLERYQNTENIQEKLQIEYNLSQQPAFRELLKEYDKLKDK